jgi:hypothetical protein
MFRADNHQKLTETRQSIKCSAQFITSELSKTSWDTQDHGRRNPSRLVVPHESEVRICQWLLSSKYIYQSGFGANTECQHKLGVAR